MPKQYNHLSLFELEHLAQLYWEGIGWSRDPTSLAYSISFLSTIPITLIVGWLGETFGVRRVVMMSSLIVGFGLMLTGTITQLWQLYLYYGVRRMGRGFWF
jgi:OFA family oxalate/formate antiporter-like MFS transporter